MAYVTKYIVPFISLKGTSYKVEIQAEGYTGTAKELIGSATPFTVKLDDNDFLYSPCRFSTASLRLVGDDYLQELFSTNYQQYRIILKAGTSAVWVGFVSPEVYTQDYANIPFELEVQCNSAMATLEYLDYKKVGESCTFVSIFDVLKQCVKSANADYSNIFVPHVYASSEAAYTANENVFEKMTISEQNFFDEDGKALKLKEVLEEVCKFLGWTCVDAFGSLYFVDVDYSGDYLAYSGDFSSVATRSFAVMNVQQIGFAGDDHTLDILGGYSKASVKASNYKVFSSTMNEDFDNLTRLPFADESVFYDPGDSNHRQVCLRQFYKSNCFIFPRYNQDGYVVSDTEAAKEENINSLNGAVIVKRDNYDEYKNPQVGDTWVSEETNYSFEELIQVRRTISQNGNLFELPAKAVVASLRVPLPAAVYSDKYGIAISASIQLSSRNNLDWLAGESVRINTAGFNPAIPVEVRVGGKVYDEATNSWVSGQTVNNKGLTFLGTNNMTKLEAGEFVKCYNKKNIKDGFTSGEGCIIPFNTGEDLLAGELQITIRPLTDIGAHGRVPASIMGYNIKDLKIEIINKELGVGDVRANKNSDTVYENIVNDKYINECDEIEFKINSYNNDEASFSKALLNSKYLTDNLYCKIANRLIRPEEQLIRRIINQYSATKIKLKQVLVYSDAITPATRLSDNYTVNRIYLIAGGEIDYSGDKFDINMIELR